MTTTPLTGQQLDEIEASAAAATPGPWCTDSWEIYQGTEYEPGLSMWIGETCRGTTDLEQDRADAAFVAAARTDVPALLAEVRRQRDELDHARALAADATEFRMHVPEDGGTTLLVRRQASAHGTGWAVSTLAPGGGRAWTTEGWQESISALSVDRLFCWPDPAVAAAEARRALAAAAVSGAADSRPA